ncbi:MAG TPA: hypothetical protein VFB24_00100 [Candidatus Binatia bacterium]|nr:hypothetical protein [Candidatus Binatia bacterium]
MRRTSLLKLAMIAVFLTLCAESSPAQWTTPTIDGQINPPNEYGTNNQLNNAGITGQTWYMTWDANNLYVGIVNANIYEGGVLYIKANPQNPPTCCSNADGNLSGFNYDNEQFTSLPFRATFVTYFKNGYREYRTADGFGNWSGQPPTTANMPTIRATPTPANWPFPGAPSPAAGYLLPSSSSAF